MHVCLYIHTQIDTHAYICMCLFIFTFTSMIGVRRNRRAQAYLNLYVHTYTHTHTHVCVHACMHVCVYTCEHGYSIYIYILKRRTT